MVGCSYAAVPLYRRFCQAMGYGGTVQRKESVGEKIDRHAKDGRGTFKGCLSEAMENGSLFIQKCGFGAMLSLSCISCTQLCKQYLCEYRRRFLYNSMLMLRMECLGSLFQHRECLFC